ncbi:dynein light intermediate chain-domain-containing protein [Lineolata rhizophorae]|uniref:Dynein light intermediate chain-domain-containing protein n=1 Tax=Lineolata rhizophorae TaxID=578093 RepID=A0A6A6NQS4_9PEZI|nr:dynein light intermediate chain-domain-containing protein [Lineolata rhizophorae]
MRATGRRVSTYMSTDNDRPRSSDGNKRDIWSSMLDGASSGRRLPAKNVLVLGGTPESQREFLDTLGTTRRGQQAPTADRNRKPPIANQFALGYTYQDVMDADHEDVLARLSLYLLTTPHPNFARLLSPLLTPKALPHTLIVILLDWTHPWLWVRQLRAWIRVLRAVLLGLPDEAKDALEANIDRWRAGRTNAHPSAASAADISTPDRPGTPATTTPTASADPRELDAAARVALPLGPGEYDEPLGMPLLVVAQRADRVAALERERGWGDDEFDFVLQYLRTLLLKHGGGLAYVLPASSGALPPGGSVATDGGAGGGASGAVGGVESPAATLQALVHSALGLPPGAGSSVPPVGARNRNSASGVAPGQRLKHNVVDRERILVPPHWDSWGKIRVLREGFDVEGVSQAWSSDIRVPEWLARRVEGLSAAAGSISNGTATMNGAAMAAEDGVASPGNGDMAVGAAQTGTVEEDAEDDIADNEELIDDPTEPPNSAVAMYEDTIKTPPSSATNVTGVLAVASSSSMEALARARKPRPRIDTPATDNQSFLAQQLEVLERLKAEDEAERRARESRKTGATAGLGAGPEGSGFAVSSGAVGSGVVEEHIGPVQFNVGGIHVDAEEVVKRLKDREATRAGQAGQNAAPGSERDVSGGSFSPTNAVFSSQDDKAENEALSVFFKGLANRSVTGSPRPG